MFAPRGRAAMFLEVGCVELGEGKNGDLGEPFLLAYNLSFVFNPE
jgi:hypothetical protein